MLISDRILPFFLLSTEVLFPKFVPYICKRNPYIWLVLPPVKIICRMLSTSQTLQIYIIFSSNLLRIFYSILNQHVYICFYHDYQYDVIANVESRCMCMCIYNYTIYIHTSTYIYMYTYVSACVDNCPSCHPFVKCT